MDTWSYLKNLWQDPHVASVTPTSRAAAGKIMGLLPLESARLVVEYGPGTGVLTRFLLPRLSPQARLIAFETNPDFVRTLRRRFTDPRFSVEAASAENIGRVLAPLGAKADIVLSGIPFLMLSPETKHRIISETARFLQSAGVFVLYQSYPRLHFRDRGLTAYLKDSFGSVDTSVVWQNVPPYKIYHATRPVVPGQH